MACQLNGEQRREQLNYKLKNIRNSHEWMNERKGILKPKRKEGKTTLTLTCPQVSNGKRKPSE
jgi:hypothetical protein